MLEGTSSWERILESLIVTIPAIIAAVSSVRNGRALKKGAESSERLEKQVGSKSTESGFREYRPKRSNRPDYDR